MKFILTVFRPPLLPKPVARRRPADFRLGDLGQRRRRGGRGGGLGRGHLLVWRRLLLGGLLLPGCPGGGLAQPGQAGDGAALGREADLAGAVRARPLVAAALGRLDVPPRGPARRRGTAGDSTWLALGDHTYMTSTLRGMMVGKKKCT